MTTTAHMHRLTATLIDEQHKAQALMRKLTKMIGLLLTISLLLSVFLAATKALPFCYTISEMTVTVAAGDTLWDIAARHIGEYPGGMNGYLAEICRRNGLSNVDEIASGTELRIPIYHYRLG